MKQNDHIKKLPPPPPPPPSVCLFTLISTADLSSTVQQYITIF